MRKPYISPVIERGTMRYRVVRCSVRGCGFEIGRIYWREYIPEGPVGWEFVRNPELFYDAERGIWRVGTRYNRFGRTDRRPMPRIVQQIIKHPEREEALWPQLTLVRATNRPAFRMPATVICPHGHQTVLEPETLGVDIWIDSDGVMRVRD